MSDILILCTSQQECCDYGNTNTWEWLFNVEDPKDDKAIVEAMSEQCNLDPDYDYTFQIIHVSKKGDKYTAQKLKKRLKRLEQDREKAHLARLDKKFGDFTEADEKAEYERLKKKYK